MRTDIDREQFSIIYDEIFSHEFIFITYDNKKLIDVTKLI